MQSTASLETRLQAAGSLSTFASKEKLALDEQEDQVYRRAGMRTPAEAALRDLFGGPAWLVRILQMGVERGEDCHVVFVRTQSRDSFVPKDLQSKITILDASQDPWGWDEDDDDEVTTGVDDQGRKDAKVSLRNLSKLFHSIRSSCVQRGSSPVLLIWEGLAPLFLVHGFDRTLAFLKAIDSFPRSPAASAISCPVLQVWSIRTECLTPSQNAHLEDASNALLCLSRGEMTLMRQGFRERGNLVREVLPFRLMVSKRELEDDTALPLLIEEQDAPADITQTEAASHVTESLETKGSPTSFGDRASSKRKSGRSKVQLRLESDDEVNQVQNQPANNTNRPRIFLQDDDAEFADMDEEDPDDDLDI